MGRAHSKPSKGSRYNPVDGAVVIKKGGGGGERVRNKPEMWVRDLHREMERNDGMSTRVTREDQERMMETVLLKQAAKTRKQAQRVAAREAHRLWLQRQSAEAIENAPDYVIERIHKDSHLENYR